MTAPHVDAEFAFDALEMKTRDMDFMARVRREKPVCRPAEHVVLTSRYHDTANVFRDAETFSSVGDMRAPGVIVAPSERFLGEIDAPLHPKIRRILHRGFTLKGAARIEPWTRAGAGRRLDALARRGGGDLMADLAVTTPGSIAAHVLGIPDDMHERVMQWCLDLLHSTWPATGKTERGEGMAGAFPEFSAYLDGLIAERESAPEGAFDDLLTVMARSEDDDGWKIGAQHVRTLCANILAGSLSATYMLGNLFYRYLTDERFAATLRAQPAKIPAAVDESLRFETPVHFLMRTARTDTVISGHPVAKGEHIMLGIASANRDESVFRNAGEFRLDREGEPPHLAFGFGPHICVGNHLTRMVGRVVLEEAIARFRPGQVRLVEGFEWVCVAALHENGPASLDVAIA